MSDLPEGSFHRHHKGRIGVHRFAGDYFFAAVFSMMLLLSLGALSAALFFPVP